MQVHPPFRVGGAEVDPSLNSIKRQGATVHIEPRLIKVLVRLAQDAGRAVSRDELISFAWPDGRASDEALTKAISQLRSALGDDDRADRIVETIPKVGYRLRKPISERGPTIGDTDKPDSIRRVGLHRHAPFFYGAVAALAMVVIGNQLSGSAEVADLAEDPPTAHRTVKMQAVDGTSLSEAIAAIDSTFFETDAEIKAVRFRKVKCLENKGQTRSDFEYFDKLDIGSEEVCGDAVPVMSETLTLVD